MSTTQPYQILYNDNLKWQRNRNSEVGVDLRIGGTSISLVGYFNRTKYPYKLSAAFEPFSYNMMGVPSTLPDGTAYTMPANPAFRVDSQTGEIFVRDKDNPRPAGSPCRPLPRNGHSSRIPTRTTVRP